MFPTGTGVAIAPSNAPLTKVILNSLSRFRSNENAGGRGRMRIEIVGKEAESAVKELLNLEEIEGSYVTRDEAQKEGVLTTIATIVAIAGGSLAIAEKLYNWYQKYKQRNSGKSIEKAMIIMDDGQRFFLENVTLEQLKKLLDN